MKRNKKWLWILQLLLAAVLLFTACGVQTDSGQQTGITADTQPVITDTETAEPLDVNGAYTTQEDVALYLHLYGRLPDNFITKAQARDLGWEGGSLEPYAPGKCIGGSYFGNYEGMLPEAEGRSYAECDINTRGENSRGPERIVYSNDGLVYYTGDHYESFTLLYGEEAP